MKEPMLECLPPGAHVLDVGAGRRPALSPDERPEGCTYVGLDLSRIELEAAPAASYDQLVIGDVDERRPDLEGRFDLVVAWQVLEHLKPLAPAIGRLHSWLRPGGRLVALTSGRHAAFAMINRVLPDRLADCVTRRLLNRVPNSIFPAHYDDCDRNSLIGLFGAWKTAEVIPFYRGAGYFRFSRSLQRAYLGYENWAVRAARGQLATHYLVVAEG